MEVWLARVCGYTAVCRASAGDMAAAARADGEPDEKNIMDDGDWQSHP